MQVCDIKGILLDPLPYLYTNTDIFFVFPALNSYTECSVGIRIRRNCLYPAIPGGEILVSWRGRRYSGTVKTHKGGKKKKLLKRFDRKIENQWNCGEQGAHTIRVPRRISKGKLAPVPVSNTLFLNDNLRDWFFAYISIMTTNENSIW